MLSATPFSFAPENPKPPGEVDYFLRRAEEEAIAEIRSLDPRAAASHSQLSALYSAHSLKLIANAEPDEPPPA